MLDAAVQRLGSLHECDDARVLLLEGLNELELLRVDASPSVVFALDELNCLGACADSGLDNVLSDHLRDQLLELLDGNLCLLSDLSKAQSDVCGTEVGNLLLSETLEEPCGEASLLVLL